MDSYEFDEGDIIFSDYSSDGSVESNEDQNGGHKRPNSIKRRTSIKRNEQRVVSSTLPINIPGRTSRGNDVDDDDDDAGFEFFENGDEDQMMRLPPHVIVERRVSAEMARSFSPLKARYLYELRNSVLRKTGFY